MMEQQEKLMARVIDIFAQTFDKKAVLRGGMVLRLLGAPRCTNGLNADDIRAELSGYLPSDEIDGLDLLFRAALTKLS